MFSIAVRLAAFYFAYYATLGAFTAYWAPYLVSRGFSATDLGITYALAGLSRATVPLAWGWLADRSGRRMGTIRAASVASLLLFMAIPFSDGVLAIMLLTLGYTLFWNALLPQFEVVAIHQLDAVGGDYSRVRAWGSLGFILALMAVGWLIDRHGIAAEPWFVAVLFAMIAVTAWAVPDVKPPAPDARPGAAGKLAEVLRRPEVIAVLVVCFCSQFSFAPYYQFFTLLMDQHGYSRTASGLLWSLGVAAEIGVFLIVGRLIARYPAGLLLTVVMAATTLRWLLIGWFSSSLLALLLAQLLHALSFGVYHSLAMHYVKTLFPGRMQGRGQALYNSASYGIGGSLGSLATGWMWEHGPPVIAYTVAAAVAAAGAGVAWRWLVSRHTKATVTA